MKLDPREVVSRVAMVAMAAMLVGAGVALLLAARGFAFYSLGDEGTGYIALGGVGLLAGGAFLAKQAFTPPWKP